MFGLFEKKSPEERLLESLRKKNWDGLSRAYYDLGVAAMEQGDLSRAVLWLSRADTVYSASDKVYKKTSKNRLFHDEIVTDCSDRIGELEDAPLLSNQIVEQIEEKAEELEDIQVRVWSLLTLARLVPVGEKLAALPGCRVLGALGQCVDLVLKSFQEPVSPAELDFLRRVCGGLYELSDAEAFFAGGEVPCAAGAPLQVFDLNALTTLLNIEGFIDGQLRALTGYPNPDDGAVIPCALLPDYWARTAGEDIASIPQVRAELDRIWNDYEWARSGIDWTPAAQRIDAYKALDVFQPG